MLHRSKLSAEGDRSLELGEWVGRIVAALEIAVGEGHRNLVEVRELHSLAEERELRIVAAGAGRMGVVAEERHMEAAVDIVPVMIAGLRQIAPESDRLRMWAYSVPVR